MSEPPDRKLVVAMGVLFGAMFVGVVALIVRAGWPKGEKVAEIDLLAPAGSATVDAAAGDRLHFRTNVSLGPVPSKSDGYAAVKNSRIAIALVSPDGSKKSADCAAYNGENLGMSNTNDGMSISGAPIECTFTIAAAGKYVVQPRVTWSTAITVKSAKLEVRREPKS